jgi:tetratricopeptide (TPR) repeat protein
MSRLPGPPRQARQARAIPSAGSGPWLALGAIFIVTLGAYAQVRGFAFLTNYDDSVYVTANPAVRSGLTAGSVIWAFTHTCAGNWHPLTMLSHMLDVQLFGVTPGPAHVVSLLLHLLDTLLLFRVLALATGRAWPSVFAAGLFALHPAHVESVAWIAERKDVLSTALGLLALEAYVRGVRSRGGRARALVAVALAAGLLAKPMLVTLPFVLLLLDAWPLGRLALARGAARGGERAPITLARGLGEKWLLFVLAAVAIAIALRAQAGVGAMAEQGALPLPLRLANACVSTVRYVELFFAPRGLAAYYPYPSRIAPAAIAGAALLLAAITLALVALRRRAPYALVGWLWFLITLVPVIGLVQVGAQAMADRYTYVPYIGLSIAVSWGAADLFRARRVATPFAGAAAAAALLVLAALTARQVTTWRDGHTVFARAVRVTRDNAFAWGNLGIDALDAGRLDEALADFQAAARAKPDEARAQYNLGVAYRRKAMYPEAEREFARTLALSPHDPHAQLNLGLVLAVQRRYEEAFPHYEAALALMPDDPDTRTSYSNALSNAGAQLGAQGRREEAIRMFRRALEVEPGNVEAKENLELASGATGH